MNKLRSFFVCLLFVSLALSAHAATYVVPSDREMIQRSDDIVIATGVTSVTERTAAGGIVTRYTLRIEEVLKGKRTAGQHLVLTELGGTLADGRFLMVADAPEYAPGERYLVFTNANHDGDPVTFGMSLGQFALVEHHGRLLALREHVVGFDQNSDTHVEIARDAQAFGAYIKGIVAREIGPEATYFVADVRTDADRGTRRWDVAANAFSRGSYLLSGNFRWQNTPNANFLSSGTPPSGLNGDTAVTRAIAEWNGTQSNISYSKGGTNNTAVGGLKTSDNKDTVLYGDPNNEVNSPAVAIGGAWGGGSYNLDGETFVPISEADIVVNESFTAQQCVFNSAMTHEMGHTLGLRHSNQVPANKACGTTAECTSSAIMNSTVSCPFDGRLQDYDKNAASTVYGSGATSCTAPSISTQPANKNLVGGGSTSLSVTAAGTAPLSYQWYTGTAGDTTAPVSGGTNSSVTVTPTVTTSYWVRVTNACGTADSNAATVTVAACQPVTIGTQPQNRTITAGASATLNVQVNGTSPFQYQWYIGPTGNTSNPATSSSSSIVVSPTSTTSYWVLVTNSCGRAESAAATVTVSDCPAVNINSISASPVTGGTSTLSVTAASAGQSLSYAWFRGTNPGSGGSPAGTSSSINVPVTEPTSYWVRVTNACGQSAISNLVTVAPCTLPSLATDPADQTIAINTAATLSLQVAGSGADTTIIWYRGLVGDRTAQVGVGASVSTGPLATTTQYWAAIRNTCGEISSRQVTINVTAEPCLIPTITTQPLSQTIADGNVALSVVATGSGALAYQWYQGVSGDVTTPVGTNAPAFAASGITQTTSYWVRVSNACGGVNSATAQITVAKLRRRAVGHR